MEQKPLKIRIAIPCMDSIPTATVRSLLTLQPVGELSTMLLPGSLVYLSRERLTEAAIRDGVDWVLWLDSDMLFPPDLLPRLLRAAEEMGSDMACGLAFMRRPPFEPVIYDKLGEKGSHRLCDYPEDARFNVEGCGFGAVLTSTTLLIQLRHHFGRCFEPLPGFGEDLSFCIRARQIGAAITCDSSVKLGHIAHSVCGEETFKAFRAAPEAFRSELVV